MNIAEKIKTLNHVRNIIRDFLGETDEGALTNFPIRKRAKLLKISIAQFNELAMTYKKAILENSDAVAFAIYLKIKENPSTFAEEITNVLPSKQYLLWGPRLPKTIEIERYKKLVNQVGALETQTSGKIAKTADRIQFDETLRKIGLGAISYSRSNDYGLLLKQAEHSPKEEIIPRIIEILKQATQPNQLNRGDLESLISNVKYLCHFKNPSFEEIQMIRGRIQEIITRYRAEDSVDAEMQSYFKQSGYTDSAKTRKLLDLANDEDFSLSIKWSNLPELEHVFRLQYRIK